MSDLALKRVQCRYVYCRRYFQQVHGNERYCCLEHRMAQERYIARKRYAEEPRWEICVQHVPEMAEG